MGDGDEVEDEIPPLAAAMLLPRPDRGTRRVDDQDDHEALRGLAAALPPSLVLCGIVLLVLAALG